MGQKSSSTTRSEHVKNGIKHFPQISFPFSSPTFCLGEIGFYQLLLAITDVAAVKFSQYHYGENSIFFTIFPNYADFSNTL